MTNESFEERLRISAKKVGSLKALSEKSGIKERTIAHWLNGTEPKINAMAAVADAADVSVEWLITGRSPQIHYPESEAGRANPEKPGFIDIEFFLKLWKDAEETHKKYNFNVQPLDFAALVAATYNGACDSELADQPNAVRYNKTKEIYEDILKKQT